MNYLLYALCGLVVVAVILLLVIIIRTLNFKPKSSVKFLEEEVNFNGEKAVENLRELVRFKTVSYKDSDLENNEEFERFIAKLPELYPNVFKKCSFAQLPDRALLFKWEGKNHNAPTVLMAHYDVVPVNEELWDKPALKQYLKTVLCGAEERLTRRLP